MKIFTPFCNFTEKSSFFREEKKSCLYLFLTCCVEDCKIYKNENQNKQTQIKTRTEKMKKQVP